ncbi:hypothetical protein ACFL3C_03585 [Patescibacteria group bacterium]
MKQLLNKFKENLLASIRDKITTRTALLRLSTKGLHYLTIDKDGMITLSKKGTVDYSSLSLAPAYAAKPTTKPGQKAAPSGRRKATAPTKTPKPKLTPKQQAQLETQQRKELIRKATVQARAFQSLLKTPYTCTVDTKKTSVNVKTQTIYIDIQKNGKPFGTVLWGPKISIFRFEYYDVNTKQYKKYGPLVTTKQLRSRVQDVTKMWKVVGKTPPLPQKPGKKPAHATKPTPTATKKVAQKPTAKPAASAELNKQIVDLKKTLGPKYTYISKPKYGTIELSLPGKQPFTALKKSADGSWVVYKKEGGRWKESYRGKNMAAFKADVVRLAGRKAAPKPLAKPATGPVEVAKQKAIQAAERIIGRIEYYDKARQYTFTIDKANSHKHLVILDVKKGGKDLGSIHIYNPLDAKPTITYTDTTNKMHRYRRADATFIAINAYANKVAPGKVPPVSRGVAKKPTAKPATKEIDKSSPQYKRARVIFKQGIKEFDGGHYKKAIITFKKSLSLSRDPKIHTRIALSYKWLGEPRKALKHYKLFLKDFKPKTDRDKALRSLVVSKMIPQLEKAIAKQGEKQKTSPEKQKAIEAGKLRIKQLQRVPGGKDYNYKIDSVVKGFAFIRITNKKGERVGFAALDLRNKSNDIDYSTPESNKIHNLKGPKALIAAIKAYEKTLAKKEAVKKRTTVDRKKLRSQIGLSQAAATEKFGNQMNPEVKGQVTFEFGKDKRGSFIIVKFKGGRKGLAERKLTLGELFKFVGNDIPHNIRVIGRTWGGRQDKIGTYYSHLKEFHHIKGSRLRVYHGNKLYFGPRRSIAIASSAAEPLKQAQLRAEAAKRKIEDTKERKNYEAFKKKLGERVRMHDESINLAHFEAFMNDEDYDVPRFLQSDSDWKTNWKFVSRDLLKTLAYPPFKIGRVEAQRKFLQEAIQLRLDKYIQPSDFFKVKIEGRSIYNGSYSKFKGRYEDLLTTFDKKEVDPWGDTSKLKPADKKLVAEFLKMNETIKGIARVLDALSNVTLHKRMPETADDRYRPLMVGIGVAGKGQKEHYKNVPSKNYHSLKSLLHKHDGAPEGIAIGASDKVLANFKGVYFNYFHDAEQIADFKKKYVDGPANKGGLKLLFMSFGFNYLVAKGYLRKLSSDPKDKRYILVKTPTRKEWATALSMLPKHKPALWSNGKDNFQKWERIRESLNRNKAAQRFINKIFSNSPAVDTRLKGRLKSMFKAGRKTLDMAYLSKVTYNNEFYARFISPERGRISFTNDNLKDAPEKGSNVYELNSQKVLTKANLYIWLSLWHDLSYGSAEGKYEQTVNKIAKDFHIPGSVLAKFDTSNNAPPKARKALLAEIYKRIELKNLNPSKINPAYGEFIRTGFVLARQQQMAGNFDSFVKSLPEGLSTKPMYRKLQIEAFKRGCPIHQLPQIEQRVNAAIFATLNMGFDAAKKLDYVEASAGGVVSVNIGKWLGAEWKIGISGLVTLAGVAASGGIEAAWAWGKAKRWQLGFKLGAGADVSYGGGVGFHAGAEATFQFPLGKSAWDMYASAWAGIRYKQAALGIGGGIDIGAKWNQAVADRKAEIKSDSKRKIKDIEKLRSAGKIKELAAALRKHPVFGDWFKEYERKMTSMNLHVSDEVMVDLYTRTKAYWQNKAREGVKVPPVVGVGIRVIPYPPFVIPYIDINIGGNKVIYTTRREHPLYNERTQTRVSNEAINQKLKKQIMARHGSRVVSKLSILAKSGSPFYDARVGRTNVVNRPGKGRETSSVNFGSRFESIKSAFAKHHIHIRRVKLAGHGNVIELTPLRTEGSNVEFVMPPGLGKAVILDKSKNRVLLAASMLKKLYITRQRIELPYRGHGDAVNKEVIVFKTNRYQTTSEIRQTAPHTIYKYRNQKYRIVAGSRRDSIEGGGDIITLAEFNKRRDLAKERASRKIPKILDYKTYMALITRKPPLSDKELRLHFGHRYGKYETTQAISRFQDRLKKDRGDTADMRKALQFEKKVGLDVKRSAELLTTVSIDYYKDNKKSFDNLVGSISGARDNEMGIKQKIFKNIQSYVIGVVEKAKGRKLTAAERAKAMPTQHELNLMYSIILDHSFVKVLGGPDWKIKRRIEARNKLFKAYLKTSIKDWKRKYPNQWKRIKENVDNMPESKRIGFKLTIETLANHIVLTMPQTVKQLKEFIKSKTKPIGAGMRFASYSQRSAKNKAMPATYGMENHPVALAKSGIFRLINAQPQNLNSPKPLERAAARTILSMLSPLDTGKKRLDSPNETIKAKSRAAFLKSDLPILLLSLQDPNLKVSPLIRVLGRDKFNQITELYKGIKKGLDKPKDPKEWITLLNKNEAAFQIFRAFVEKVRHAQLNNPPVNKEGDKEVVFGKSIIRIHTELGSGGYLKCMNGTVYLKRSFSFSSTDTERHEWVVASDKRRTGVINRSGKAARKLAVGAGLWASAKGKKRPPGGRRPPKQTAQGRR